MIKSIFTLLILFSTVIMNGQSAILLKNFNPKAKELKHTLNTTRDSLLLGYKKSILNVEIFNEDFEKMVTVGNTEAQISLNDLPAGKFVVYTKLEDKTIVLGLIKHEQICDSDNTTMSLEKKEIAEGKGMMLDEALNVIKSSPKTSIEFLLTGGKTKKHTNKKQKYYWVITKVNNESASTKTMKLVNQESVDRMIIKNKLENNSISGRLNELTAWEVYDKTKFMEHQMSNSDFINSSKSDLFNTSAYYSTENNSQNI